MQIPCLDYSRKTEMVSVAAIIVMPPRRQVDTNTVASLAEAINKIGLQSPIIVRETDTADFILVTGLHRLEAFRRLERDSVPAFVLPASTTETEARMIEISENLHRFELTQLERSNQIDEWRELAKVRKLSAPSNNQPAESGAREAARELGVDEKTVRNASKIASIIPEAQEAARNAGIDDNQSKLLKVAAAPAEEQVAVVEQVAQKYRDGGWRELSPRTLRRRQAEEEAREKSRREHEATIKDRAAALIDRHGLDNTRAFAESLLAFPIYELPDLLEHLVGVDVEQRADGSAT
jgi:ParB family chromosome partitioning protein